ncbi:hypothetical protein MMC17_009736 [Xylographa soralifera]|nr:hypothetical protein [Xylographa soralifera]
METAVETDGVELLDVLELEAEILAAELVEVVEYPKIELVEVIGGIGMFPLEPEEELEAGGAEIINVRIVELEDMAEEIEVELS